MARSDDLEVRAPFRRAPFADNPTVGERGTQTHDRILAAALEVFGETGYHACRVERITELAGCSRPSFYQYFSSKEDLFRQLAGQVARRLGESTQQLAPVTPDAAGWDELRRWIERYAEIYDDYEPVFAAFAVAASSDETVATGAERVRSRDVTALAQKIGAAGFRKARAEHLVASLLAMLARANRFRSLLASAPRTTALPGNRMNDALADVVHRALFGGIDRVNIRETRLPNRTLRSRSAGTTPEFAPVSRQKRLGPAGREMRKALLDAGAKTFVTHGYHATRVDDITAAAGVAHGTFYRYFGNKDELFRIIAAHAGNRIAEAVERLPDLVGDPNAAGTATAIERWLREYTETYEHEGAIIRVWTEAMARDPELNAFSAGALDRLRGRAARFLAPRGFGDIDADALVFLALVDAQPAGIRAARNNAHIKVVTDIIRRGLLGAT